MGDGDPISRGLVRVWGQDGSIAGAGFLVADRTILTCRHVVAQALGKADADVTLSDGPVAVDFALITTAAWERLEARTVALPVLANSAYAPPDVAILQFGSTSPAGSSALPLSRSVEVPGNHFRTFGFPAFSPDGNGEWAEGLIEGSGSAGLLQIRSLDQRGRRVQAGFSGAPVWDVERGCVAGMVAKADAADRDRVGYAIPARDLSLYLTDFLGTPACPYRGLSAFQESDAAAFFGRDEFIARLRTAVGLRSLVTVAGPSGMGKSSVVAAGLAAQLHQHDGWTIARMRPKAHPFEELARAVVPLLEPDLTPVEQLAKATALAGVIRASGLEPSLSAVPAAAQPVLLIIDQFEELFTLSDQAEVQPFIDVLIQAARGYPAEQPGRFCQVLTIRSDFLTEAADHPGLADAISPVEMLGNMKPAQLRRAIEQPARDNGVRFADGLVQRILADAPDAAQLPLVQFLLTALWDQQHDQVLTHSAYQQLGGVGGALAQHAEQVFGRLSMADQERARAVLIRLVTARSDGAPATCRVADRAEFPDDRDWGLVEHFSHQRLVLLDRDLAGSQTAQIVHEALLSKWDRLSGWIAEGRKRLVMREEVRGEARRWASRDRDEDLLLRGRPLLEAEDWSDDPLNEPDPLITKFLTWSRLAEIKRYRQKLELFTTDPSPRMLRSVDEVVRVSHATDDFELEVSCLEEAIRFRLTTTWAFSAFKHWQQLWRLEEVAGASQEMDGKERWDRAVSLIWLILLQILPVMLLWVLSWYATAWLLGYAINYGESTILIALLAAAALVSVAFWLARRGFRHPVLAFPPFLLAAELMARIFFVRTAGSYPVVRHLAYAVGSGVAFLIMLEILRRRWRRRRSISAQPEDLPLVELTEVAQS